MSFQALFKLIVLAHCRHRQADYSKQLTDQLSDMRFERQTSLPFPTRSHHFKILLFWYPRTPLHPYLTLILKQPVPLLPPLSIPNSTTVTLCATIFWSLKWIASNRSRTLC